MTILMIILALLIVLTGGDMEGYAVLFCVAMIVDGFIIINLFG